MVAATAGALVALTAWAASSELVELSAPVLPVVTVLYAEEGASFPDSLAAEADLAHRAALGFSGLVTSCASLYPAISQQPDGGAPLTPEQLAANYEAVARCAYEQHTSKPYWIPRLVDDVDICGTELGAGWRLPTEEDVAAFTEDELQGLSDALSPARGSGSFGALYFSMQVYVRGTDGALKQADLSPGLIGPRVAPLACAAGGDCWTRHLESGLALRCIRRTSSGG